LTRAIVLGAGVMGTAFTLPMSDNGMDVALVGTHLDRGLVSGMEAGRVHGKLKAQIGENVTVFQDTDMGTAFAEPADLVVVGVSTPGIDWAIEHLARFMRGTPPILLLTKGIAETKDRIETLPDYCAREFARLGKPHGPFGGVGGPCIAGELAVRRFTSAVVGLTDMREAARWANALSTAYYRLRPTADVTGLEICAALKNFFAIGVSVMAGRASGDIAVNSAGMHNATASLFNQAVDELRLICAAGGGNPLTATGLAGLGDLHVTCQAGRNSKLGRLLGAGASYSEAMAGPLAGETVEGTLVANALRAPLAVYENRGLLGRDDLPLVHAIIDAVASDRPLEVDWAALHRQPAVFAAGQGGQPSASNSGDDIVRHDT
jgi:glycerol-3-phosphate dehydrogenase (NAD(P)+)